MSQEKQKITATQIIGLLDQGMKRDEIGEHLGLTPGEVKKLFKHPSLKGKQARKPVSFIFEDDLEEEVKTTTSELENANSTEETMPEEVNQEADAVAVQAEESEEEVPNWENN